MSTTILVFDKNGTIKKVLSFFIAILGTAFFLGCLGWGFKTYLDLPIVKFSVSRQEVVAVENARGEQLLVFPLPEKYKLIYVK